MKKIVSIILALVILTLGLCSCGETEVRGTGASSYLGDRDITGRRIYYAEFCIENYGRFVILLDSTAAPATVAHFSALIRQEFYNGKTFHYIGDRVLQGGCPFGNGSGNIETSLYGEFEDNGYLHNDLRHRRGVISMVRGDEYDSASCQFFICTDNYYQLDGQYAAFGYIVEGMSVIDAIVEECSNYMDTSYEGYDGLIISSLQPKIKWARILDSGWNK